jgi:hypothetical protein
MSNKIQTDFGKGGGMSLFIPYAHGNTNEAKVRKVFDYLGTIRLVKFLNETNKTTGKEYKMVYIYFEKWNETKNTRKFQKNVQADGGHKVKYNDGIGYWTVLPNKHWVQKKCEIKQQEPQTVVEQWMEVLTNYNDTYESIFNRDLREIFACDACERIVV